MSPANVEIVRRIYLLHPDIEWVNPSDALESGIRTGIEAFTSITEELDDTIGDFGWTSSSSSMPATRRRDSDNAGTGERKRH